MRAVAFVTRGACPAALRISPDNVWGPFLVRLEPNAYDD